MPLHPTNGAARVSCGIIPSSYVEVRRVTDEVFLAVFGFLRAELDGFFRRIEEIANARNQLSFLLPVTGLVTFVTFH